MRSFVTHMLAGVLGALALGVAGHAFAAPTATAKPANASLVWQDSVYKLCYSLKEAEAWIHPDQAYLVHRIVRCGIKGRVYTTGG